MAIGNSIVVKNALVSCEEDSLLGLAKRDELLV